MQQALLRLTQGRTTIVIAHRLSTVRNADRILVLTAEGIGEEGTHDELIAQDGVYANLHSVQAQQSQRPGARHGNKKPGGSPGC